MKKCKIYYSYGWHTQFNQSWEAVLSQASLQQSIIGSYRHISKYRNDPKFSDRYAWANNADPRGAVWSGSTLFAIPSASFGLITLW